MLERGTIHAVEAAAETTETAENLISAAMTIPPQPTSPAVGLSVAAPRAASDTPLLFPGEVARAVGFAVIPTDGADVAGPGRVEASRPPAAVLCWSWWSAPACRGGWQSAALAGISLSRESATRPTRARDGQLPAAAIR